MNFRRMLAPFASRNYRLFFGGQIVSLAGTWMTQTATVWLVYHLTHSAFWLGVVAFCGQIPALLLAPAAGVWVDRLNRRHILVATQTLGMLQSFALAFFTLRESIDVTKLATLAAVQGIINAFDMPARQALPVLLVENKALLANVIATNVSMFHLARLTGPAIAGFVIASAGAGWCFLLDGVSYLAVIVALAAMRLREEPPRRTGTSAWREFRGGLDHAIGFRPIRRLILLTACFSLFGASFAVLVPAYAREFFGGDARTLGLLMSCSATGSVLAAVFLSSRKSLHGLDRMIGTGATLMGFALVGFACSRVLALSAICLLAAGSGSILVLASNNTLLQNLVDDDKRGRVMSFFGTAFLGGMPLGSLLTGSLAHHCGLTPATCANGVACLVLGTLFFRQLPAFRELARAKLDSTSADPPTNPAKSHFT